MKLVEQLEKDCRTIKTTAIKHVWFMRGGVSYEDMMNMSPAERLAISELIEENLETTKRTNLPFF